MMFENEIAVISEEQFQLMRAAQAIDAAVPRATANQMVRVLWDYYKQKNAAAAA